MFGCLIYDFRKPKRVSIEPPIRMLLFFAGLAVSVNATAMCCDSLTGANILFSIYYICADLMIMGVMSFVRRYTEIRSYIKGLQLFVGIAVDVDAFLMIRNCFKHNVFQCELAQDRLGALFYRVCERETLFRYHTILIYVMSLLIISDLIQKIRQSPRIYKIKYATILIAGCIVFVAHTAYLQFHLIIDYAMMWYALVAFSIFYFSLFYIPRGLMDRLLFFTISNMEEGIICLDVDGKCVHANKAAKNYCVNEIEQQVQTWFEENISDEGDSGEWCSVRRVEGEMRHYEIEYKKMFDVDAKYIGCFFYIHDCTEETNRLEAEKYRATHDSLTGIYNKEHFCERSQEMIQKHPEIQYCVICSDVKNFKIINDIFGVETGDRILLKMAGAIRAAAKSGWIYGRLTGDKFAVCMPVKEFDAEGFMQETFRMTKIKESSNFRIHTHIGVYVVEDRNLGVSVMCDRANLAIKTIKESYQTVVAYYKETLREDFLNEQRVISDFDKALQSGEFQAYVQPQVFAKSGEIRGGEVLVRWIHPKNGMIPPYKFIPTFENTGLIGRLDKYMWELACIQLRKWQDEGKKDQYLSVNISQKDFYLLDVYQTVTALVERYQIPPKSLHLEITETAIMNNPGEQLPLITRLREYGFLLEIDDFGSGYSSLNTLKDLHADVLKIDMGFLRKTEYQERSKIILKMAISLAKALHMEVITEGVETPEQVKYLREYGCDIFQGYHFAKPMPMAEFEEKFLNQTVSV